MEGEESNMNDRIIQHLWKLRTEESDGSKDMAHLEEEQGLYWHLWSLQLPSRIFSADSSDASINFLGRDHGEEDGRDLRSSAVHEIIKDDAAVNYWRCSNGMHAGRNNGPGKLIGGELIGEIKRVLWRRWQAATPSSGSKKIVFTNWRDNMRFRICFVGKRDNGGPNQSIKYGLKNCFYKVTWQFKWDLLMWSGFPWTAMASKTDWINELVTWAYN